MVLLYSEAKLSEDYTRALAEFELKAGYRTPRGLLSPRNCSLMNAERGAIGQWKPVTACSRENSSLSFQT